tara:strand:- start:1715 stop:2368 length:654 start_codon:yes stop_codon:yes gene_type:complete
MASIFDVDPKTGLTGVQTLLGNVTMPSLVNPQITNKQLIDAAILRGSLELLKPRQAGENFASQAVRALDAATEPGRLKAAFDEAEARRKAASGSQLGITDNEIRGARKLIDAMINNNPEIKENVGKIADNLGDTYDFAFTDFNKSTLDAIGFEALSLQNAEKEQKRPLSYYVSIAIDNILNNKSSIQLNNQSNNTNNSNQNINKDSNKPDLVNIDLG